MALGTPCSHFIVFPHLDLLMFPTLSLDWFFYLFGWFLFLFFLVAWGNNISEKIKNKKITPHPSLQQNSDFHCVPIHSFLILVQMQDVFFYKCHQLHN